MSTWYDIKLRTMQKMFATSGNTIPNDAASMDYLAAMPGVANEALQRLSTAGKFIVKSIQIAHNPVANMLTDGKRIRSVEEGTIELEATGARSMYAEVYGVCKMQVYVGSFQVANEDISSGNCYTPIKRLINNPDKLTVKVVFTSAYPLAIKNFALYSATFVNEDAVQPYSEVIKYDLTQLAPSFYMLTEDPLVFEGSAATKRYMQTSDYFQEGGRILVLDRDVPGNYTVYYKAYPAKITSGTADDYELEVDPEVDALIPLYMASQLYKDDDNGIATTYRNEFEVGLQSLKDAVKGPTSEVFVSESGWI